MRPQAIDELVSGAGETLDLVQMNQQREFPIVENTRVTFVFQGTADRVSLKQWIYGLPSSIPLIRDGESELWYCSLQFPVGSRIEYKFGVLNNGNEEWILDPLNPQVAHDPFGSNSVVHCSGYHVPVWSQRTEGVPQGTVDGIRIASRVYDSERTIPVYLPANFQRNRRYRLLLVHDGDDYQQFSNLRYVLDNLIARLEIPPLVVALLNPHKRNQEYANDRAHADFIVTEVLPALEQRWSIIDQASARCLMGASFGAVASLSTAWHYPNTFDRLLLQSGSFAFTDIGEHSRDPVFDPVVEFVNEFRRRPGQPARRIFVSCGVYESLIYENRSLVPFLQRQGIEVKYVEAFDGHNWENWRDRLRDGLSWLFPGPLWVTYM